VWLSGRLLKYRNFKDSFGHSDRLLKYRNFKDLWASEIQKLQRFFGHLGNFRRIEKTKFFLASQVQ
ncbi:17016_t:CDS:2, partial [Rhizophagus irregularis]